MRQRRMSTGGGMLQNIEKLACSNVAIFLSCFFSVVKASFTKVLKACYKFVGYWDYAPKAHEPLRGYASKH
jgi:hypothetical protein